MDAGERGAQSRPLVHVSLPTYVRLVVRFHNFAPEQIFGRCMQQLKNIWGSFDLFLRYRGRTSKFCGGVNYTNFLPRRGTNRKYFLSAENIKQICIKQLLYTLAISVIVLELTGEFFAENFRPRSFSFLTNFRRIDFPYNLLIDAH